MIKIDIATSCDDIATSCDDMIIESIEQSSSSKGKQVVEADDYDEFVKLKNDIPRIAVLE